MTRLGGTGVSENTDFDDDVTELVARQDRLNPLTLAAWQADPRAKDGDVVTTKERNAGEGGGGTGDIISGTGTVNTFDIVQHNTLSLSFELRTNVNTTTKAFGALHDGVTDDTDALQRACDKMAGSDAWLISSVGIAMVDAVAKNVKIPNDINLCFMPGSEWKALTNSSDSYIVMDIRDVTNVHIWNPVLTGDRDTHILKAVSSLTSVGSTATVTTEDPHGVVGAINARIDGADQTEYNGQFIMTPAGASTLTYSFAGSATSPATGTITLSTGEQGHCLNFSEPDVGDTSNIHIYNPILTKAWGDNVVIRKGSNIHFYNLFSDEARRNGITINKGINVHFHGTTVSTNTNGTAPEAGLDIEPNDSTGEIKNIMFDRLITGNNVGAGVTINIGKFPNAGVNKEVSITVLEHIDRSSIYGLNMEVTAEGTTENITGSIRFGKQIYTLNKSCGVYYNDYAGKNTPTVYMDELTIINPNFLNSTSSTFGAGIAFDRKGVSLLTNDIGNCVIRNLRIVDNLSVNKMTRGIAGFDNAATGANLFNVKIIDPIEISGFDNPGDAVHLGWNGMELSDRYNQSSRELAGSLSITSRSNRKLFSVSAVQFTVTDAMAQDNAGMPLTIEARGAGTGGIKFIPEASRSIFPFSSVAGKFIATTERGGSITMRFDKSENTWYAENPIGNWTVEP